LISSRAALGQRNVWRLTSRFGSSMLMQDAGAGTPHPLLPIHGSETATCLNFFVNFFPPPFAGSTRIRIAGFCSGGRNALVQQGQPTPDWRTELVGAFETAEHRLSLTRNASG